jgi:uncharacterized protein (DUF927 family)
MQLWHDAAKFYVYRDIDGNPNFRFGRCGKANFFQHIDAEGKWRRGKGNKNTVLYKFPEVVRGIADGQPIYIVEGEKDVETLNKLGLIATTNPCGAGKWKETYTLALKGATKVVIFFDNDQPGKAHAQSVASSLCRAGIAVYIVPLTNVEDGEDVTDWLEKGHTKDELLQLVDKAQPFVPSCNAAIQVGNFVVDESGVYFQQADKPPLFVCSGLKVMAETRDCNSNHWGKLLEWRDPDGKVHSWAMPMNAQLNEVVSRLTSEGLVVSARDKLLYYIQTVKSNNRILCTDKVGWLDRVFVLPGQQIGDSACQVVFQSEDQIVSHFEGKGTLPEWREHIAARCTGNSRLVLVVCIGLVGPLLGLFEEESGGFHLRGKSSTGKTTLLIICASVWGGRDFVHTWRATANALEATAKQHNHTCLILDEISQSDPSQAGAAAYMLANGKGKQRANKLGGARDSAAWTLAFLSSGELSLADHMAYDGKKARAGQEVRMVDLPADAAAGHGVFDDLQGMASGADLSDSIKEACAQFHGKAGPEFVRLFIEQYEESIATAKHVIQQFLQQAVSSDASGQVNRAAKRFALLAAAGELATEFGITGWPVGEASSQVARCFADWIHERGGTGQQEESKILEQVRRYFEQHGDAKFADWGCPGKVMYRAGFRRVDPDSQRTEFFVLPESYKAEVCKGFNVREVSKFLMKHGILATQPSSSDSPTKIVKLPDMGRTRCYHITGNIWGSVAEGEDVLSFDQADDVIASQLD